jgi:hypothetical protein
MLKYWKAVKRLGEFGSRTHFQGWFVTLQPTAIRTAFIGSQVKESNRTPTSVNYILLFSLEEKLFP